VPPAGEHRYLASLPTRRSSDLRQRHAVPDFEIFDYPGQYLTPDEGERYSRLRIEALHAEYQLSQAATNVRELAPGWTFKLEHHRSEEHTSELQSRENLVCRLLL